MLLDKLCSLSGVPGCEDDVRKFISSELAPLPCVTDALGNLLVRKGSSGKRIMLAAHMDEVGLIVSDITEDGFLKFKTVGSVSSEVLTGKRVFVGTGAVPGIIGVRAVHLQKKEERKTPLEIKSLYIDIGAQNREQAEEYVSLGDAVTFDPSFRKFGNNLVCSKALDDRAGCAIMTELAKDSYNAELCMAFTVQEEIGCRGAAVAARQFKPDLAVVIEATICTDFSVSKPHRDITTLGGGPALTIADASGITDCTVRDSLIETAKQHSIPWQYKRTTSGGTDAGEISRAVSGIPTAVIALPCRNLHSPSSVISLVDYENTLKLLKVWLKSF